MVKLTSILAFTASALVARADYGGLGTIRVWNSNSWDQANPSQDVGCVTSTGKFINPSSDADCGVFSRLSGYPYTLSTSAGNCTFNDASQEVNSDSKYGKSDHAWNCLKPFSAQIIDELYTVSGFSYTFLCTGDMDCYFDTKGVPAKGQTTNFWAFRWGSQQQGITPGHMQLQLVWNPVDSGKGGAATAGRRRAR